MVGGRRRSRGCNNMSRGGHYGKMDQSASRAVHGTASQRFHTTHLQHSGHNSRHNEGQNAFSRPRQEPMRRRENRAQKPLRCRRQVLGNGLMQASIQHVSIRPRDKVKRIPDQTTHTRVNEENTRSRHNASKHIGSPQFHTMQWTTLDVD